MEVDGVLGVFVLQNGSVVGLVHRGVYEQGKLDQK